MKETATLSLANFDAGRKRPPYLTSPRSLEACRRVGIDPSELLTKSKQEFLSEDCKGLDREAADIKYDRFLARRQVRFDLVSEERLKLIEEEAQGLWTFSKSKGHSTSKQSIDSNLSSALIEREKRELERIQRRQQQEIQQIIEHEVNAEAIRERNEEKAAKAQEKEARRMAELKEKHQIQELKKRQEEDRKRQLAEEETNLQKQRAHEEFEKQIKKKEEETLKDKLRRKEAKERERLAAQKREEFAKNTEELANQQKQLIEERKRDMEAKETQRRAKLEEQQSVRKEQTIRQAAMKAAKLETARENLGALLEEQRISFEDRQKRIEEKRLQFEEERKKANEEARVRAERKAEEIRQVIRANQAKEEERKIRYMQHKEKLTERQAYLAKCKEEELKQKAVKSKQKQDKLTHVRETNVAIVTERIGGILDKQRVKDEAVQRLKSKRQKELVLRKTVVEEKRQDRFDAVKRMARQQDYQREKVMDRIQDTYERVQQIHQEKQAIIEQRKKLRLDVETQKKQLIQKFERIKRQKGGLANTEELSALMKTVKTPETQAGSKKTLAKPKPQIFSPETNAYNTLNPETKVFTAKLHSKLNRLPGQEAGRTERSRLEDAKKLQFKEMSALLAEEQDRELQRERQLAAETDATQRDLLEKQFGLERALSSQRIIRLSE
jgi:hypothetical protein